MTDKLPPQLLALFAARPPLKYVPPTDHPLENRKTTAITGVAAYAPMLNEEFGNYVPTESHLSRQINARLDKQERQKKLMEEDYLEQYKPKEDKNIRGTGYETLFVSRLSYDTTVEDLSIAFGEFGPIERIRIPVGNGIQDKKRAGKPLGYAFIQFKEEADMKAAYKRGERMRLKGREIVVDCERGRTIRGWRPRRFGGGLGGRHYTKVQKPPPRFNGPPSGPGFRGGDRGGFRGGFRGGRGGFEPRGGRGGGGGFNRFPPSDAPMGPRSGYGGGGGGGGGGYRDRNANYEPVVSRDRGFRDRDGPRRDYEDRSRRF